MPDEIIDLGDSPPTPPDADFWLDYGRKMVTDGPAAIRSAATSLMTGLSALQGIYLGILGFAKFIPEDANVVMKGVFTAPLLAWMVALYHCLQVMLTETATVHLNDPTALRQHYETWLPLKHGQLHTAYWWMFGGLIMLVVLRLKL